jgi:MFS family permease
MNHSTIGNAMAPFRAPAFRTQFAAQAISTFGTSLAPVATALGVLDVTKSASALALVTGAYSVALLAAMISGGVWADRLPRNVVLTSSNLVQFVAQAGLGVLLIYHVDQVGIFVVLQVMNGVAQAFNRPALLGITNETAPAGTVQQANALIAGTRDLSGIVGPLIASVLVLTAGAGWALILDALTYIVSAVLLIRVKLKPRVRRERANFLGEVLDGWREVQSRSWLWASICYFAVFNLAFAILQVLGPLHLSGEKNGAFGWGIVVASMSVGGFIGNLAALRFRPKRLLLGGRILDLISVLLFLGLAGNWPVLALAVASLLFGVSLTFGDALWYTALVQEVPEVAVSRVSAFDQLGSMLLRPVGYAVAAGLANSGLPIMFLALAILLGVATLATLLVPSVRRLSRRKTDVLNEGVSDVL